MELANYFTRESDHDCVTDTGLPMWNMVRALNIEISAAITGQMLTAAALGGMKRNCHRCLARPFCAVFLESRDGQTASPPSYCPNRKQLAKLVVAPAIDPAVQAGKAGAVARRVH